MEMTAREPRPNNDPLIEQIKEKINGIEAFHSSNKHPDVKPTSGTYEMPGGAVSAVCTRAAGILDEGVPVIVDKLEWTDEKNDPLVPKRIGYMIRGHGPLPGITLRARNLSGDWVLKIRLGRDKRVEDYEGIGVGNGMEKMHHIMIEQLLNKFTGRTEIE